MRVRTLSLLAVVVLRKLGGKDDEKRCTERKVWGCRYGANEMLANIKLVCSQTKGQCGWAESVTSSSITSNWCLVYH